MTYRVLAALFACLFLTTATAADPIPPPTPISAIVHLKEGCTGFHLGNGLIGTASHCITKLHGIEIELSDGTVAKGSLALLASVYQGYDDLAVIRIGNRPNFDTLELDCGGPPAIGTDVHMTGYPQYYGLSTVWGKVATGPRPFVVQGQGFHRDTIGVNIAAFGGFSGSPVMTEDERIVGILVAGLTAQMNLAMMVPAYRLCELMGDAPVA